MVNVLYGITLVTPEIIIFFGGIFLLIAGVMLKEKASPVVIGLSVAVLSASLLWIFLFLRNGLAFMDSFLVDPFARLMKCLILSSSIVTLVLSVGFFKIQKSLEVEKFEYSILVLFATLGMMLMVSANDMLSLYLALELQSLSLYVIASMGRHDSFSAEAGLKYFILGAVSSGFLLYGISLIYGYTGHIDFYGIGKDLEQTNIQIGLVVGFTFLLAGLAFKISAVPFHMWMPDVYQGAPLPFVSFLASASKIAAIAVLIRVCVSFFPAMIESSKHILMFMAFASMIIGAFGAIGQKNIKRLIAYASIAQIGYPLAALATGTIVGLKAVIIYFFIYIITILGTFAFIIAMQKQDRKIENIDDFAGLSYTYPFLASIFTIFMFSFAGLPPLAGFWAKWFVLVALIDSKMYFLLIIALLCSVISAFYYLRIIRILWFEKKEQEFQIVPNELQLICVGCGSIILCYIFFGNVVQIIAEHSVKSFF